MKAYYRKIFTKMFLQKKIWLLFEYEYQKFTNGRFKSEPVFGIQEIGLNIPFLTQNPSYVIEDNAPDEGGYPTNTVRRNDFDHTDYFSLNMFMRPISTFCNE